MNFSVIIPTYKREVDLEVCLDSILKQTILPAEVIIIDDYELPQFFVGKLEKKFESRGVGFIYHQKDHDVNPRGSSTSRNLGIELSSYEVCFIFDDDLILDPDFFEKIMSAWDNDESSLIGIGGVIKNNRKRSKLEHLYSRFFGFGSPRSWDVNNVGFQDWDDWIEEKEEGYYIHGGVCSYKKSLVQKLGGFMAFGGGRAALEDVDFCLRAKQSGYHFLIEPQAKVTHNHSPSGREDSFTAGFKEGYNRKVIFRKNSEKSLKNFLWFVWANVGWGLKQLLTWQIKKAAGMTKGIFSSL